MNTKYYKQVANMSISDMVRLISKDVITKADKTRQCYAYGFLMSIANYIDFEHYDEIKNCVEGIKLQGKELKNEDI